MIPVRRPIRAWSRFSFPSFPALAHHNHRIQIPPELVHGGGEPLDVRLGEIALIWGGFHQIDREGGEYLPVATERVPVWCQYCAAVGLDGVRQPGQRRRLGTGTNGIRRNTPGAWLGGRSL